MATPAVVCRLVAANKLLSNHVLSVFSHNQDSASLLMVPDLPWEQECVIHS